VRGAKVAGGSAYSGPEYVGYRHPEHHTLNVGPLVSDASGREAQTAAATARLDRWCELRDSGLSRTLTRREMGLGDSTAREYEREWERRQAEREQETQP
jgi:hypothetical protein